MRFGRGWLALLLRLSLLNLSSVRLSFLFLHPCAGGPLSSLGVAAGAAAFAVSVSTRRGDSRGHCRSADGGRRLAVRNETGGSVLLAHPEALPEEK